MNTKGYKKEKTVFMIKEKIWNNEFIRKLVIVNIKHPGRKIV